MDILGFLLVLAGIGIAPRFGLDDSIKLILSDAWATGRQTYFAMRRRYVHLAARPTIIATLAAMALQALALWLASWLMPDMPWPLIIATGALMALEGFGAWRSRLAIPHWLRDNDGALVRFPANLPPRVFFHAPAIGVTLDEQGRYVNRRGHFVNPDGTTLAAGQDPVAVPFWDQMLAAENHNWLRRVSIRVMADNRFLDADGRFVNAAGQFVNEEGAAVPQDQAQLHERAGEPALNPAHRHLPGRFSLGWSLARILGVFLVMGVWIAVLGIQAERTPIFMIGVACVYAALGAIAVLANFAAWFLLKGTKLMEFIATVVSEEVLTALPGIKWGNIKTYLPGGVNILEEEKHAAALRAMATWLALHLAPFVMLVWSWTNPGFALFAISLLFITALAGTYLAKNGGALEVADKKYKFARLMFYALPAICVLGFLAGLVPDVKEALTSRFAIWRSESVGFVNGEWGIGVGSWYANLAGIFGALVGAAIFGFILSQLKETPDDGRFRRWARYGLGLVTAGCLAVLLWFGFALYRNIAGKGEIRLSQTADVTTKTTPRSKTAEGVTPALSSLDTNAMALAAAMAAPSTTAGASSPSKGEAAGPVKPQPKPVPAAKPAADKGERAQAPSRQARVPRWQLDPDFTAEYRRIVGEEP